MWVIITSSLNFFLFFLFFLFSFSFFFLFFRSFFFSHEWEWQIWIKTCQFFDTYKIVPKRPYKRCHFLVIIKICDIPIPTYSTDIIEYCFHTTRWCNTDCMLYVDAYVRVALCSVSLTGAHFGEHYSQFHPPTLNSGQGSNKAGHTCRVTTNLK